MSASVQGANNQPPAKHLSIIALFQHPLSGCWNRAISGKVSHYPLIWIVGKFPTIPLFGFGEEGRRTKMQLKVVQPQTTGGICERLSASDCMLTCRVLKIQWPWGAVFWTILLSWGPSWTRWLPGAAVLSKGCAKGAVFLVVRLLQLFTTMIKFH